MLADVFMPVRNGYEVCDYIKRESRFAHIPVVLLIGAFDPLDEKEAHRVGANGILKKPFVPPEPLISMVTGFLAGLEKLKPASQPAPEPARVAPPPPAPASPAQAKQEFPEPEMEPEEFAFTRGPLSLRDAAPAVDSNEEPETVAEAENKLSASWEDRIKPQPPSDLEQRFAAEDARPEKPTAWDDRAELKPSSSWQPQVSANAPSSMGQNRQRMARAGRNRQTRINCSRRPGAIVDTAQRAGH